MADTEYISPAHARVGSNYFLDRIGAAFQSGLDVAHKIPIVRTGLQIAEPAVASAYHTAENTYASGKAVVGKARERASQVIADSQKLTQEGLAYIENKTEPVISPVRRMAQDSTERVLRPVRQLVEDTKKRAASGRDYIENKAEPVITPVRRLAQESSERVMRPVRQLVADTKKRAASSRDYIATRISVQLDLLSGAAISSASGHDQPEAASADSDITPVEEADTADAQLPSPIQRGIKRVRSIAHHQMEVLLELLEKPVGAMMDATENVVDRVLPNDVAYVSGAAVESDRMDDSAVQQPQQGDAAAPKGIIARTRKLSGRVRRGVINGFKVKVHDLRLRSEEALRSLSHTDLIMYSREHIDSALHSAMQTASGATDAVTGTWNAISQRVRNAVVPENLFGAVDTSAPIRAAFDEAEIGLQTARGHGLEDLKALVAEAYTQIESAVDEANAMPDQALERISSLSSQEFIGDLTVSLRRVSNEARENISRVLTAGLTAVRAQGSQADVNVQSYVQNLTGAALEAASAVSDATVEAVVQVNARVASVIGNFYADAASRWQGTESPVEH
eukprot:TRINITY_DN1512_c0_g1_i1.p1 TRINITY_DN1512_c0_g1~~TRINITY_DN1512_c0_g1_i1.p1  ORF type:complete len:581 (-),score=169.86 TRINITY_DN1512_c0_g1_i1:1141-2838(-)